MTGASPRPKPPRRSPASGPAGVIALVLLIGVALACWVLRPRPSVVDDLASAPAASPSSTTAGMPTILPVPLAEAGSDEAAEPSPGDAPAAGGAARAGFDDGDAGAWTAEPLGRRTLGAMPPLPKWTPSFAKRDGPPQPWVVVAPPLSALGFAWPLRGVVSSPFGEEHPLGIDIAPLTADGLVLAARDGLVIVAGGDPCCNYGYYVIIDHGQGITSVYGHLRESPTVREGEWIARGTVLGVAGETGHSYGVHLHFEVRVHGSPVDPEAVITVGQVVPLLRPAATATPTATPSATPTPTPIASPTPGATEDGPPVPSRPVVTPSRATPSPSRTPARAAGPVLVLPTATATAAPRVTGTSPPSMPAPTLTATPTATPAVTATATSTPTATATPTATPDAAATVSCQRVRFLPDALPGVAGAAPFVQLYGPPDGVPALTAERCAAGLPMERAPVTVRATTAAGLRCAVGVYATDGALLRRASLIERVELVNGVASVWAIAAGVDSFGPLLPPSAVIVLTCVGEDETTAAESGTSALAGFGTRGATVVDERR